MSAPILVVGDPHGHWDNLHDACRQSSTVGDIILLGDHGLSEPLADVLAAEIKASWQIRWIIANHDTDTTAAYDHLAGSLPDGDIGGRCIEVGGLAIGGLGGTYRGRVWYPRFPEDNGLPIYLTRQQYLQQIRRNERFRGGPVLSMRPAIFPEDHACLVRGRLDVLVSHEAPRSAAMKSKGFHGLSQLLDETRARLCVHGHHHTSYMEDLVLPSGRTCRVRGLAIGEVWRLEMP
jgi:Icc-related predicted phosphoesterase